MKSATKSATKTMIVKELIEKLDPKTRENLWNIIIDRKEYSEEENTPSLNLEVHKWELDYGICERFFQLTLRIYTVDYEPYFFEDYE